MKPVIGIAADAFGTARHPAHRVQEKYLDAVAAGAGALAVILPAHIPRPGSVWADEADIDDMLGHLDGVFLPGSVSNVDPAHYGAPLLDAALPADAARDYLTLRIIRRAVSLGLPLLGVCRGFQEINVALGGTLHQAVHTVPGHMDHREREGLDIAEQYAPVHDIALSPGGILHLFSGMERARVNSLHGQGVDRLAPPLAVDAVAPDGLIEAFRLDGADSFLLGVQWHPEWQFRDDALSVAIFRAFGLAARAYKQAVEKQR